ncbi:MAG TPA: hypothetical protein O0X70_05450 [Methanocorpusculum sp.]|nr:hypothetical protein [Methanocorpusculum sp.]
MAEAFNTNIVLKGKEAEVFMDTMVNNTPEELLISQEELAEINKAAKELGLEPIE